MTLLDAYALVAYLIGGPAQEKVKSLLREGGTAVATVNLAETYDIAERVHSLPASLAYEKLEGLFAGPLAVVHLDPELAKRAAELRVDFYHRSHSPLSLADAILIASARSGDRIATADPDVLATASKLGVETVELPGQD
ncbi:MAG TPA: PIN domain-containing protein [Solirubrobacterales bacterium]|nr:PIN domain-containing protein [Solirubrobacterales bacterium]